MGENERNRKDGPSHSGQPYPKDPSTYTYGANSPRAHPGYRPTDRTETIITVEANTYRRRRVHTEALLLFENVSEQHKFIQRVYGLLCLMVLLTSILTTVVMFVPVVGTWIKVNWYLMVIAMLLDIVFIIILCCVKVVGRTFPWNVIVLLCLVSTHNYVMAFVCAWFEIKHILIAFGITAGVIGVLTLFAFRSTCDFTSWRPYLVIVFLLLVLLGLCACFFWSWILDIFFCSVGVAVLCIIIVYDTQLVIGGKHRQAVLPSEYIFGAVILYLDVCLLFIFVLSLVGLTNN